MFKRLGLCVASLSVVVSLGLYMVNGGNEEEINFNSEQMFYRLSKVNQFPTIDYNNEEKGTLEKIFDTIAYPVNVGIWGFTSTYYVLFGRKPTDSEYVDGDVITYVYNYIKNNYNPNIFTKYTEVNGVKIKVNTYDSIQSDSPLIDIELKGLCTETFNFNLYSYISGNIPCNLYGQYYSAYGASSSGINKPILNLVLYSHKDNTFINNRYYLNERHQENLKVISDYCYLYDYEIINDIYRVENISLTFEKGKNYSYHNGTWFTNMETRYIYKLNKVVE